MVRRRALDMHSTIDHNRATTHRARPAAPGASVCGGKLIKAQYRQPCRRPDVASPLTATRQRSRTSSES